MTKRGGGGGTRNEDLFVKFCRMEVRINSKRFFGCPYYITSCTYLAYEECSFFNHPMAAIKGEICGA
jgi:hypothetical protein